MSKKKSLVAASLLMMSIAGCGTTLGTSTSPAAQEVSQKSALSVLEDKGCPEDFFTKLDLDEDDFVTREEFLSSLSNRPSPPPSLDNDQPALPDAAAEADHFFSALDADQDGKVSLEEFKSARHPAPLEHFGGRPHGPMMPLPPEDLFNRLDLDEDDFVTREEFLSSLSNRPSPPPSLDNDQPALPDAAAEADHFFSALDADQDGKVSLEEFKSARPPAPPCDSRG